MSRIYLRYCRKKKIGGLRQDKIGKMWVIVAGGQWVYYSCLFYV